MAAHPPCPAQLNDTSFRRRAGCSVRSSAAPEDFRSGAASSVLHTQRQCRAEEQFYSCSSRRCAHDRNGDAELGVRERTAAPQHRLSGQGLLSSPGCGTRGVLSDPQRPGLIFPFCEVADAISIPWEAFPGLEAPCLCLCRASLLSS